jgi:hypothetical protein
MKDYEAIPNSDGMFVLRDVSDLASNTKSTVVLRSITEDFWRKVADNADPVACAKIECQKQIGNDAKLFAYWNDIVSIQVLCVNRPE